MADPTPDLRPQLLASRLPDLDLGSQAVHPAYGGLSILNLPTSLCRWLGASDLPHPPLAVPGLDDLAEDIRQVILVLVDAVGFDRFLQWLDGPAALLRPLADDGLLVPLTSVVPSTTSTALTTIWTGRSPAEHAQMGYELFLKEFGVVANMLTHSPAAVNGPPGMLERAGFEPESALPVPTLGTHLTRAGVDVHAFLPHAIRHSGLSRMHLRDVVTHGYATLSDFWLGLRELAERPPERRRLIWGYYGEVDALSHRYGPEAEVVQAEFVAFAQGMLAAFGRRLPTQTPRRMLLLVVSDHGQIPTPRNPHFEVRNHPGFTRCLHLLPTGESRLSYLYVRPGQADALDEYVQRTWPGAFRMLSSEHALQAGLFGPGLPAPQTAERIGDRILVSQGHAYLWSGMKENVLRGRHGGVSPDEMLVPLLAARL